MDRVAEGEAARGGNRVMEGEDCREVRASMQKGRRVKLEFWVLRA